MRNWNRKFVSYERRRHCHINLTQDYFEAGDQLVYSFDDWVGYGFHGDFFNGWKPGAVEALLEQCTYHTPVMLRDCTNKS